MSQPELLNHFQQPRPQISQRKLSLELLEAANQNNIQLIHQLLQICDLLHNGQSVPNYTASDLPSDAEYEYYKNTYNYQTDTTITESTIMYMATIPKDKEIVEIQNAIIMAKYDGVSAATLFTKTDKPNIYILKCANTRGRTIGNLINNTDITSQISSLIKYIQFDFATLKSILTQISDFEIFNIAIRGELILNYKQNDNAGQTLNCPAAAVAGLVNGKLENFIKQIDKLCLQFYEIAYIDIIDKSVNQLRRFIPTQAQAVILLKQCYIKHNWINPSIPIPNPLLSLDTNVYTVPNTKDKNIDFNAIYSDLMSHSYYPTDGLVYCNELWQYPQEKEAFGKKDYGKHAWKPTNICYSLVEGVEWPLTKNGELNPIVQFEPFMFNGSKYSQCQLKITKLIEYQNSGFGIGARLIISIVNLKTAHIDGVLDRAKEVYKIPTKCPYCDSPLTLEAGKTKDTKHLMCRNDNCIERKIQKYTFFLKSLGALCELTYKNKNGKVVKSKISEAKLRQIYQDHGRLDIDTLLLYIPNMITALDSLSHENQLYVLNFGGIKQIQALIQQHKTNNWRQYDIKWFK